MASEFIIDVNETDFEIKVMAYSQEVPVVIDFWAEWCAPCRVLGPIIEKLAVEAQGGFRLAKLNVDENPNLAKRFQIHSIPAVKAIRDGKLIAEFSGMQPEQQVRDFLRNVIPNPDDLLIEKGFSLLQANLPIQAEQAFRQALQNFPDHPGGLLGLSKCLLLQGRASESMVILQKIPASREYTSAETLKPLAQMLVNVNTQTADIDQPLEAAYLNCLNLIKRGNLEAAMDGLLDILRQDKYYRDGLPRKIMLAIFELLGDNNPNSREYRNELASVLF